MPQNEAMPSLSTLSPRKGVWCMFRCSRNATAELGPLQLCARHLAAVREVIGDAHAAQERALAARERDLDERERVLREWAWESTARSARLRAGQTQEPDTTTWSESVVYFAALGDYIKIGTTKRLDRRLADVGLGRNARLPAGLEPGRAVILMALPGSFGLETDLHERFAEYRIPGTEWFSRGPELLSYIELQQQSGTAERRTWPAPEVQPQSSRLDPRILSVVVR